jgi:hypothetical protein
MKTLKRIVVRTRWEGCNVDMKFDVTEMKEARRICAWINSGATEFGAAKIVKVYAKTTESSPRVRCECGDSACTYRAGG